MGRKVGTEGRKTTGSSRKRPSWNNPVARRVERWDRGGAAYGSQRESEVDRNKIFEGERTLFVRRSSRLPQGAGAIAPVGGNHSKRGKSF